MRYFILAGALSLFSSAFVTSCGVGGGSCSDCDSMRVILYEYMQRDSMKSDLLRSYDEHLTSFGNIQDSIEAYEHQVDSLVQVIKRSGNTSGAQNSELQKYVQKIRNLISQNQQLAEELQNSGYKNASMDKLVSLLFANVEAKQAELRNTQQEISELRSKVTGLQTQVDDLTMQNTALSSEVTALNTEASKISGSVKVLQPKERKAKKIQQLDIFYNLNENPKAQAGTKTVYFRIVDSNGKLLDPSGDFDYQGSMIAYTLKADVSYSGKAMRDKVTWMRSQSALEPGSYTVDFFIDDHKGTSDSFTLDK